MGFIIAENSKMESGVCRAISDYVEDMRDLETVSWVRPEWYAIKRHYPEGPTGIAFNATVATLIGENSVEIRSYHDQFDTIRISEADFSRALGDFETFLRGQG
ncbi:hypothetical protein [Nocardia tengchongensis]